MKKDQLGIGIVGSGFNARFYLHAFVGVRDVARPISKFPGETTPSGKAHRLGDDKCGGAVPIEQFLQDLVSRAYNLNESNKTRCIA
jgi:hypothetical protein